ncbi:MAG: carbon-nitrogen family hydrolase [Deferrisomatales bacterium]
MRVASVQMAVVEGDKPATIAKAVENIRRARGADLIVLPEIWNVGFMSFDRYVAEAEDPGGPTLTALRAAAREVGAYLHSGSFVERDGGRFYNSSYLISPQGELLGSYRKIHLFGYESEETRILTPGDRDQVIATPIGTFGLATCYDLRFPELFRRMTDRGAQLFLVCSAWPYPRLEHWIMLNRVRALENQCFLVSANAVGLNRGSRFVGHSMAVDPWGVILASGGDEEVVLRTEVDLAAVAAAREKFPALADRVEWLNPGQARP